VLFVVCAAFLDSQSAIVDAVDLRYAQINGSSETARNQSIVLNIARARRRVRLNFVVFSRVSGSMTAGVGAVLRTSSPVNSMPPQCVGQCLQFIST
jgi:hypothetical protein